MSRRRFHIRRVPITHPEYDSVSRPYGIFDTVGRVFVNKWGVADSGYWCSTRAVAAMRCRDLNGARERPS